MNPFFTAFPSQLGTVAISAADGVQATAEPATQIEALRACRHAGLAVPPNGRFPSLEALNAALDRAFDKAMPTSLERRLELKAKIFAAGLVIESVPINEKVVLTAATMLRKAGIKFDGKHMMTVGELDAEMAAKNLPIEHRLEIKVACSRAGLLDESNIRVTPPAPKPNVGVTRSIFVQLGIEPPAPGQKTSLAAVDEAMARRGFDIARRLQIKATLSATGAL
jgi:hypothetical protein